MEPRRSSFRVGGTLSRRTVLGVAAATLATLSSVTRGAEPAATGGTALRPSGGAAAGGYITAADGVRIYYKDWGSGPPMLFSHGWPLNADAWDSQMLSMVAQGFRVIAHDRRGHGRSDQPFGGNDFDTYADDLSTLIEALNLRNVVLVGHSVGGGEVTRYISRHGGSRIAKAVLLSAIPPGMLKTPANPGGLPIEVFDHVRASLAANPAQFYRDLGDGPFYGANRPGSKVSQGVKDAFWLMSMQAGIHNAYESIKAFSETDFTDDLKRIDMPTLIVHGDDDQNVPIENSALRSSKLVRNAVLKVYPGAPHGLTVTHAEKLNSDLLAFVKL